MVYSMSLVVEQDELTNLTWSYNQIGLPISYANVPLSDAVSPSRPIHGS